MPSRRPSLLSASILLVSIALVAGCGGRPTSASPDDGGAPDGAPDTPREAAVAGNGVPIPSPDPKNNCGALAIETAACTAGTQCPTIMCDCPAGPVTVFGGFTCGAIPCVAHVSCAVACEVGTDVLGTVISCVADGLCEADASCAAGSKCLRTPGQRQGSCSTGEESSPCLVDADCASRACVVTSAASSRCAARSERAACNRDAQCEAGRCLLEAGRYVGVCADGSNGDPCDGADDCQAGMRCLGNVYRECSDGEDDSLCDTPGDCRPGFACIPVELTATGHKCSRGVYGSRCVTSDDCRTGPCSKTSFEIGTCAAPLREGTGCTKASECESGFCGGVCTNGEVGAGCDSAEDCRSGKCVAQFPGGVAQCLP